MSKIENIKEHFKRNKKAYYAAAGGIVIGVVGGSYLTRKKPDVKLIQKATLIGWKNQSVQLQFVERSTPSIPVRLKGTKKHWDSLNACARDTGHSLSQISKNVNGKISDVGGDVFEAVKLDK